jgi:hypothetical protein
VGLSSPYSFWAIGPSVWFLAEWVWLAPKDKEKREDMKRSQDLARNIWIAVLAVLSLLYGVSVKGG